MKLTLYYAPTTCALVPLISLHEIGVEFELKTINMRLAEQNSPEYLRLNPKHKVPLLLIDGKPLTENVAMALWMTRAFPKAGILPADSESEIRAISTMAWCASGIHPYLSRINNPAKTCDAAGSADAIVRIATHELMHAFGIADELLAGRDYLFDKWCAADSHLFWCMRRAGQFKLDLSPLKHCSAHFKRMNERASVKKAFEVEASVMAALAKAA